MMANEAIETKGANWYTRISSRDRRVVDAVAMWIRPIEWQWFVTLTFPWNVRSETADRKVKALIDNLERGLRSNVCFVAGKESKPIDSGMNVPWHFHLLMTSRARIPAAAIQHWWKYLVGPGSVKIINGKVEFDSVMVEPYDGNDKGPEYCLKSMNDCFGDWLFHRLEHFHPNLPGTGRPNHTTIRSDKRARLQAALYSGTGGRQA